MWFKNLGFTEHPLDVRSNPNLIGVDDVEDMLVNYIKQGQICLLSGFTGSGKTSMLERLRNNPGLKDYNFVFLSADRMKPEHDIEKNLMQQRSFLERLTRKKPKNYVILLDESHEVSRYVTETIKGFWNNSQNKNDLGIHSVVISQIDNNLHTNFSGSFKDRIGNKMIKMKKLSHEELKHVLRIRLNTKDKNYLESFDKDALDLLIISSGGSVRALLDMTNHIFMYLDKYGDDNPVLKGERITKPMVFNILSTMGIKIVDDEVSPYDDLKTSNRLQEAVKIIDGLGAFNTLQLAKALNTNMSNARSIIRDLRKNKAIIFSHKQKKKKYWVLAPRIRHELVES